MLTLVSNAAMDLLKAETLLSPHTASAAFLSASMSESNLCFPDISVSIKLLMFKLEIMAAAV